MLIYEYKCKNCGEISEFLVGIGKKEELTCKKCGGKNLERILSTFGVRVGSSSTDISSCPTCSTGTCNLS